MVIACCVVKLNLVGVDSLKGKRSIVKSILSRLTRQFNVAAAEIDHHDIWQTAVIGLVSVGTDSRYLHGLMEKAVAFIDQNRPDIPIEEYSIEFR